MYLHSPVGDVWLSTGYSLTYFLVGKKPGQTVMVKNSSGAIEVHQVQILSLPPCPEQARSPHDHQWDAGAHQWQKVGDVVDAVGPGRRQLYEGKEYDYVFDIDVQEGAPALKLPYNVNGAPRFLFA